MLLIKSLGRRLASTDASKGLIIKPSCLNKLRQILKPGEHLRLRVESGGCSGFLYFFEIATEINSKEDLVYEEDNCKIVVSKTDLPYIKGSQIEYNDSLIKSSFEITNNPLAQKSCGCGSSFSVDINKIGRN